MRIKVAVLDENEIFRRGVISCLSEEPSIDVISDRDGSDPDVVVASPRHLEAARKSNAAVICAGARDRVKVDRSQGVSAVLPRGGLEPIQLVAAVYAAAAGLSVNESSSQVDDELDNRSLDVLNLLAEGRATNDISRVLGYSERTIKAVIRELIELLGARNRVQAVAESIRRGWI